VTAGVQKHDTVDALLKVTWKKPKLTVF